MSTLTLKNSTGADAGTVELDDAMFGVEPNVPLMHQVVTAQLAARRSGTQSTKTRAEVAGGGAKPYRQKGTGNARQGSIRSPQYAGGGIAHGPKPRKYDQKTPKKMIKAALRSALSDRAADDKIIVIDSWGIDAPKTRDAKAALAALEITGTALVVVDRDDTAAALSFRNLPNVQTILPGELNAYDVLCHDWLIFTATTLPGTAAEGSAADSADVAEGSASDEADAARGESEADAEPAIEKGSASDEAGVSPDATDVAETSGEADATESAAAEGSASDEAGDSADAADVAEPSGEAESIERDPS
jgi:large subunit ribosomal protein L4